MALPAAAPPHPKELICDEFPLSYPTQGTGAHRTFVRLLPPHRGGGWGGGLVLASRFYFVFTPIPRYVLIMSDKALFARILRAQSTDAERALWRRLRAGQISGIKLRRQAPIGLYIVDFISYDARIVIELDGGQHATSPQYERDAKRDGWLEEQGFLVLRFWNSDVLQNMDGVLAAIFSAVDSSSVC